MTGYADGPPVEMRHVMDHTVGMNAAVAVMAALQRRRATGEGSLVDVSAREVASSLLGEALLMAAAGAEPHRAGNAHPQLAPHGVYPAAGEDRWISIAVASDAEWQAMTGVMGAAELASDPRFATAPARLANRDELDVAVSRWTVTLEANAAAERLEAAGVAAHASWTTPEIAADPHLRARHAIVEVQEPDGKTRAAVKVPMRLSKGGEIGIARGTPKLGEHEDYVYGELLGMSRAERQALEDEQVIY
jgi:crotonobetainyl-CoA:carnitine CoA-transferase CaiB-like acyl-CoA transferase